MKLFAYGFWSGFHDKTNPGHIGFFQHLFEKVFECPIEISITKNDADILLETVFDNNTMINSKQWKYSFLYSGESTIRYPYKNPELYTAVLGGFRNNKNIVNLPLYIPYLFNNNLENKIENPQIRTNIPSKNICAIISNPNGNFRNAFLDKLESVIHVDYAGDYKTNIPKITAQYNTQEFRDAISEYKFIISMENSQEDTYITEKITHGLLVNTIPIYWGSPHIHDYFNSERFINVESNENIIPSINKIIELMHNEELYLNTVNKAIYKNNQNPRTLDEIVKDIRNIILPRTFPLIDHIYFINSSAFEPERNNQLKNIFMGTLKNPIENMKFISPTYKQTITDEIYNQHVKKDLMNSSCIRQHPMKKSELSLFLNYKSILEDIVKNYSDGTFLIFESDAIPLTNILELNSFLSYAKSREKSWDLIHIGYDRGDPNEWINKSPYSWVQSPYRDYELDKNCPYIEDITGKESPIRLIRKFHTRCCDSFLWSYKGIVKFLNYMNTDTNYGAAFDYYMSYFFENDHDFKQYWTSVGYFIQGSNHGLMESTIQKDTS